jgi:hypothetical protein
MIFDSDGEALGAYRSRRAAVAALRALVAADPDAADDLVLISYDKSGCSTGDSLKASDLPPQVSISPSPLVHPVATSLRSTRIKPGVRARNIPVGVGGRAAWRRRSTPIADKHVGHVAALNDR